MPGYYFRPLGLLEVVSPAVKKWLKGVIADPAY